ncbi:Acetyltransferase (GNAT) domain-containing protein [Paenibacillus uliginis N3/975]|uniref:Acetyltransferase (GNAT) domain-containing protein n=1 Tax=Paenibacillus uliginis N3/975 TaxID=1313296 RepID=A0A1X7HA09_9BACL|nr:GNAT family N-acetyltransferase [Paenibacillus uliginis]SMF82522.1 Acetyltransferase (GNAT) domain-containing protein [Paenibacillus uliginis N3/975]
MIPSFPSEPLIVDIESSEVDYMTDRMKAIEERDGNPEGVEITRIGHAVCLYSKSMPWPSFNTVKGIRSEDIPYIDDIIHFYRSRDRKFQIEVVPSLVDQKLLKALADKGMYQSGFHTSMYINPESLTDEFHWAAIDIRPLKRDEFEKYATVHCIGTGLPQQGIPSVARNNEVLYDRPGWRFFMAYINDNPAAAGVMYVKGDIASLTFAATLPEYRRQGLQQGLLRRRIAEAARESCRMVVSQCSFISPSHRNMERVGMKLGYVRTAWTER